MSRNLILQRGRDIIRRPTPEPRGVVAGGVPSIRFAIVSVDEYCATALVTVLSSPSAGNVPGENEYGQVTVHDPSGCFFDEAEADLIGRQGFAVYLYSRSVLDCDSEYDSAMHWEVHSLCCP